ncbi:MAG: hypothetical protein JNM12_09995 [Alphaproteobacteria bacterium]|nr:hypothetical protein [Alphaproteobacteria bacterium]
MTKAVSSEVLTVAYIEMIATQQPEKALAQAITEAKELSARLGLKPTGAPPAAGEVNVELDETQALQLGTLNEIWKDSGAPVSAKAFGEANECDADTARGLLDDLVKLGVAVKVPRGRGHAYQPLAEAPL